MMVIKPSKYHSNKHAFNWLIYDLLDKNLIKFSKYFRGTLVDLGCGEAPYKEFFLRYANCYIGVDWTNTMHNSKADVVSDLNKYIKLENEIADTIISLSVMEHLCEPQMFLNESYRILKKDGIIFLQVPWQWKVHEPPYDYFRYAPFGLKYMLEKSGYSDIEIEMQGGFFTMWIIKINYFMYRFVRGPKVLKLLLKLIFIPIWYVGQLIAPYLDKLGRNWMFETSGYFVLARKTLKK